LDFGLCELAVVGGVNSFEDSVNVLFLLLGQKLAGNESKSCLLELGLSVESSQIFQGCFGYVL